MSVARPARSLLGRSIASRTINAVPCQPFSTSLQRSSRRTRYRNVKAEELGLVKEQVINQKQLQQFQKDRFPDYTKDELEALKKTYSPEQMASIEAAEKAVNTEDIILQGRVRTDPYRPNYLEDYSVLDPRYDVKPENEGVPRKPNLKGGDEWIDNFGGNLSNILEKKTDDQIIRAMIRTLRQVKESGAEDLIDLTAQELDDMEKDPELAKKFIMANEGSMKEGDAEQAGSQEVGPGMLNREQAQKLDDLFESAWGKELDRIATTSDPLVEPSSIELMQDGPAGVIRTHSAETHELGKVPGVVGLHKMNVDPADQGRDDEGAYQELKRLTGMTLGEIQSLNRKILVARFVSNQTRLGKIQSLSVTAMAGNGNGYLGIGTAKSTLPAVAMETAMALAVRNMKPIRRYENRTIYGNLKEKVSGTVVEMYNRPPGFGLRCPHRIFEMCRAAGIHDIHVKLPRSKNPMNSVKAAYNALTNQLDPAQIAIGRGKKMVDARKVYYGGSIS